MGSLIQTWPKMKNYLIFIPLVNGFYGFHVNYDENYNENYNSTTVTEDNYWDDYNDYYNNADNTDYNNITKYPSIYSNTSDSYADYCGIKDDYANDDSATADYLDEDKLNDYINHNDNQNEENKTIRLATVMDNFFKKVERSWSQVKQRLSKILL